MTGMTERTETERLILRKAEDRDLETVWLRVWKDARLAERMLWAPTETREAAEDRMARTKAYQAKYDAFFVCLKETDEPIGFAGIREIAPGEYEESGVCIAKSWQNRGFGKEVLRALVSLAFDTHGGKRFVCGCFHDNLPSAAVIRSQGFVYTHSERLTRGWDGYEYLCDFYELLRPRACKNGSVRL